MRNKLSIVRAYCIRPLLAAGFVLALAFIFAACSPTDPDDDGDGSFTMKSGKTNSIGSYEYEFENRSDYKVSINAGGSKRTLGTHFDMATVYNSSSSIKVKYSPSDKVKPSNNGSTVRFNNR